MTSHFIVGMMAGGMFFSGLPLWAGVPASLALGGFNVWLWSLR